MEYEPCLQNGKRSSIKKISGPDGLEAWFVAFAACFINFVMAGLGRMSGILYVALIDIFQTDRRQASLPFSVRSSTRNLLGPVVGILGQKYGIRPIVVIGGIIGTLSAASCFYVKDILWMTIVWGGINGVGTSLTTTLPQVVIGQHFKKYLSTASGMAFSGGCVGSFLFPVLMEYLLHKYELGGTFLIIAGIIMQVIPAALILKKPSWLSDKRRTEIKVSTMNGDLDEVPNVIDPHLEDAGRDSNVNCTAEDDLPPKSDTGISEMNKIQTNNSVCCQQNWSREQLNKKVNGDFLLNNRTLVMSLLKNDFNIKCKASEINKYNFFPANDILIKELENLFCKMETDICNGDKTYVNDTTSDISTKAIAECIENPQSGNTYFLNGSTTSNEAVTATHLNGINSISFHLEKLFEKNRKDILQTFPEEHHELMHQIIDELWQIHKLLGIYKKDIHLRSELSNNNSEFIESSMNSLEGNNELSNTFYSHIKTALKLHAKPLFILICLCRSVHFLTFMPVVTTIVDFSMDKGLLAEDGKYVIAALSFGDLMGRLCFGWITDRGYIALPRYMLCVMVLQGSFTVTLAFVQSRAAIMSAIAIFGLLQGSVFVRHPVLVSRYLGCHEQSIAMGCINFFSGLLGFALPSYIGYFRDEIGSYNGIFFINGGVGVFIGLLWLFEPYFVKMSRRTPPRDDQTPV